MITANTCRDLRTFLDTQVAPQLKKEFGLTLKLGKMRYGLSDIRTRVEFVKVGPKGQVVEPVLPSGPIKNGTAFTAQGRGYTVVGWMPQRPKNPYMVKRDDGRTFKCSTSFITVSQQLAGLPASSGVCVDCAAPRGKRHRRGCESRYNGHAMYTDD